MEEYTKDQKPGKIIYPPSFLQNKREPVNPVAKGRQYDPPEKGKWKHLIDCWLEEREKEREKELDECGREIRELERPRPYLSIDRGPGTPVHPFYFTNLGIPITVDFSVQNSGNFPSWTCYVDLYEGPEDDLLPIYNYTLRGREIVSLHPGEEKIVALPWVRELTTGRAVALVL